MIMKTRVVPQRLFFLLSALIVALVPATAAGQESDDEQAVAIFAGGCFWCMEPPYDKLDGVDATISGFIGGDVPDPSYDQVVAGGTGHVEAVKVVYDPSQVAYESLLEVYWRNIDPLDDGGQFCDRGPQYRTAIFPTTDEQQRLAEASKKTLSESGRFDRPIVTRIERAGEFYPAETYHQNYYQKNPIRYRYYRYRCGRDDRLEELWGERNL